VEVYGIQPVASIRNGEGPSCSGFIEKHDFEDPSHRESLYDEISQKNG
jgi:hypothetical protein